MKLREYQIEDARRMIDDDYVGCEYEHNARDVIRRFVEMVEGWVEEERREPVTYTHQPYSVPHGDQP